MFRNFTIGVVCGLACFAVILFSHAAISALVHVLAGFIGYAAASAVPILLGFLCVCGWAGVVFLDDD